jgi:uncharacterized protein (DUF427 family)
MEMRSGSPSMVSASWPQLQAARRVAVDMVESISAGDRQAATVADGAVIAYVPDGEFQSTSQDMKRSCPDHPITIEPNRRRVRVTFNGRVIADTRRALTLHEVGYPPVQYIPRADIDMALMDRTAHATRCPHKGEASYFSVKVDGRVSENAAWSYEAPYPAMAEIKECLAFYESRVEGIEASDEQEPPL